MASSGVSFVVNLKDNHIHTCHYTDVDGERFFLIWTHVDEETGERLYSAYELDDEDWLIQEIVHADFEEMVGTHRCLHLPKEQRKRHKRPQNSFYELHRDNRYPSCRLSEPARQIWEYDLHPLAESLSSVNEKKAH